MPQPAPPAITIAPSAYPLRFAEVVNFRGDYGTGEDVATRVVNPKGVAFHPALKKVIVSLSPSVVTPPRTQDQAQDLNTVSPDGTRQPFAQGFHMHRDVESLIAIVPMTGVPVTTAHFTPGDVFVGRGPGGQITRLKADGTVYSNPATGNVFADLGEPLWGGLAFDTVGDFDGALIVLTYYGKVFKVNSNGAATKIATLPSEGLEYEGVAVAPKNFGPYGGWIIVGGEGNTDVNSLAGKVYAINQAGEYYTIAQIPHTTEDIQFVPPNGGTYYQTELCTKRERENRLWRANASHFLNRLGRMLVVNELGNELWEVAWDGTRYTQSLVGRVPGAWRTEGYKVQDNELEAGCFAILPPTMPVWTSRSLVPGGAITDSAPAVAVDFPGNLHLLIKRSSDRRIQMNNMFATTGVWTGWAEVPGGITTKHALAATLHNHIFYAFAVRDDNTIWHKQLYDGNQSLLDGPWKEVSGGGHTDVAVAATVANGRLVLAAKGIADKKISLNELGPGGRAWSGWKTIPNSLQTDRPPALAAFQDELYVFIKDFSGRLLTKVRSTDGDWTDWVELPDTRNSDVQVAAASTDTPTTAGQLYVFAKDPGDHAPRLNVASETGTWSRWQTITDGGATDTALAVTVVGKKLYLFTKGLSAGQVYMQHSG